MRRTPILFLMILIFCLGFGYSLSAKISSRVEGVVTEKETGKPLKGAGVLLYVDSKIFDRNETDENGYFKFDFVQLRPGEEVFYLQCEKVGYVDLIPDYYRDAYIEGRSHQVFRFFTLEEGEIKHVKVSLRRECTLEGVIYKNDGTGKTPFEGVKVLLLRTAGYTYLKNHEKHLLGLAKTDEKGRFHFEGLEPSEGENPGLFSIELEKDGYKLPTIENISIKSNENYFLDKEVDISGPVNLKGTVKIIGNEVDMGYIQLFPKNLGKGEKVRYRRCGLHNSGDYFFYGIDSGFYKLRLVVWPVSGIKIEKSIQIEIKKDQIKVIDFNLKAE